MEECKIKFTLNFLHKFSHVLMIVPVVNYRTTRYIRPEEVLNIYNSFEFRRN